MVIFHSYVSLPEGIFNNQRNWGNGISLFLKIGKIWECSTSTKQYLQENWGKSATVIHRFLTLPDGIFRGRINEVPSVGPPAEWILIVKKSKGPIRNSAETLQPIETHQLNQLFIVVSCCFSIFNIESHGGWSQRHVTSGGGALGFVAWRLGWFNVHHRRPGEQPGLALAFALSFASADQVTDLGKTHLATHFFGPSDLPTPPQHLACPKVRSQVSGLIFEASGSSYFDSPWNGATGSTHKVGLKSRFETVQFQESNQGISCSNPPNSSEVGDSSLIPGNSPDEKSSCFMGESYRPSIAYPCLPSGNDCYSSRK